MPCPRTYNYVCGNGIKLVDPKGEMLAMEWEGYATQLTNSSDDLSVILKAIIDKENIDVSNSAKVVVAHDTRQSSKGLTQAAVDGAEALGATVTHYGLLTTPQLHYMVRCLNDPTYGQPSEQGYYNKLSHAFTHLNSKCQRTNYPCELTVDCANGIGAPKLREIAARLSLLLNIHIANDGSTGQLNHQCGADYVKVKQCQPQGLTPECNRSYASFDGDADRIVYFYFDSDMKFHLLDGDKIASLIASYLLELIRRSGLPLNVGIVQTAYANGGSTAYMTDTLGVEVACVCTGVKHLHHRAQQFDVGVYFEANGHGTVLYSDHAHQVLQSTQDRTDDQKETISTLCNVIDLTNQTVGDAISDMLIVETILRTRDLSLQQWNNMYSDYPNRQLKVKVKDRSVVTTTDADRKVVTPPTLQSAIDQCVSGYKTARSFVRASGTEDVVRVYAEANTQEACDGLATEVARLVFDLAGGVGERP